MSLYKFFESFVDKNKELTMINLKKPMNYFQLSDYYKAKNVISIFKIVEKISNSSFHG